LTGGGQIPSATEVQKIHSTIEEASAGYSDRHLIEHRWADSPSIPFSVDVNQEEGLTSWVTSVGILVQVILAMITAMLSYRTGKDKDKTENLHDDVEQLKRDVLKSTQEAENARKDTASLMESAEEIEKDFMDFRSGMIAALDADIALIEEHRMYMQAQVDHFTQQAKEISPTDLRSLLEGVLSLHQCLIVLYEVFESRDVIDITNKLTKLSMEIEPASSAVLAIEACQRLLEKTRPGPEYASLRDMCATALDVAKERVDREKAQEQEGTESQSAGSDGEK